MGPQRADVIASGPLSVFPAIVIAYNSFFNVLINTTVKIYGKGLDLDFCSVGNM